jgi:hypothetical protein
MSNQGPFVFFNKAKLKVLNGSVSLATDSFQAVLLTSAQALSASFTGASGAARYSDLTAEVANANGYTNGGQALAGVTLALSGGTVTWNASNVTWNLTGTGITFKYFVIFDNTAATKDLVCFCDMDTTGGSISPLAGSATLALTGIETFS